jgi:hypothetical protein
MGIEYYIVTGVCILGVGYTSYNIGKDEGRMDGIRIGAGLMFEKLWSEGKPRKRNPSIRAVELERE